MVPSVLRELGVVAAEGEEHRGHDGYGEHAVRGGGKFRQNTLFFFFSFFIRTSKNGLRRSCS